MFAQALAEYGLLAAIITVVHRAWSTVSDVIANPDARLLYVVGFGVLAWMTVRSLRR